MYFDLLVSFRESQNLQAAAGAGTPFVSLQTKRANQNTYVVTELVYY
jgi:hypothetical protein